MKVARRYGDGMDKKTDDKINDSYAFRAGRLVGLLIAETARGEKLLGLCLQRRGTETCLPERRKIKTLRALRRKVEHSNDYCNPKMRKSALDDLVEYRNARFFNFPACGKPVDCFEDLFDGQ